METTIFIERLHDGKWEKIPGCAWTVDLAFDAPLERARKRAEKEPAPTRIVIVRISYEVINAC